jgi:RNA polymerase sigma factor (sigma-70 family)
MDDKTVIFEGQRTHLRAVAYRLLGSVHEADDAVQEAWLRLERSDVSEVDNLSAWLTTVVSRICLDQLRSRASRREDLGVEPDEAVDRVPDPAVEAEHAEAVGQALMDEPPPRSTSSLGRRLTRSLRNPSAFIIPHIHPDPLDVVEASYP